MVSLVTAAEYTDTKVSNDYSCAAAPHRVGIERFECTTLETALPAWIWRAPSVYKKACR